MIEQLKRQLIGAWWVIIIMSLSLIIFGGVSLVMPAVTLTVLMTLLAILIIIWGLSQLVRGLQVADGQAKTFLVVASALLILLGAVMLANPRVSVATLSFVLGWVVMLRSLIDLILSRIFPAGSRTRALWLMSGVIGVIVSFILWLFPVGSAQLFRPNRWWLCTGQWYHSPRQCYRAAPHRAPSYAWVSHSQQANRPE